MLKVDDKMLKLQIWDTAGQEKFKTITNAYYKQADAVIMVCDQSNLQSFDDVKSHWLKEAREHSEEDSEMVLILNKMDVAVKALNPQEVQNFASTEGILLYETSAKTGKNVNGVFTEICRSLIKKK